MAEKKNFKNKNNYNANDGTISEDGFLRVSLVNQGVFVRRKKVCPLKNVTIAEINYKNLKLLNKFLSERGKIIPSRVTNVSMQKQKALNSAIKMARHLSLISPVAKDMAVN